MTRALVIIEDDNGRQTRWMIPSCGASYRLEHDYLPSLFPLHRSPPEVRTMLDFSFMTYNYVVQQMRPEDRVNLDNPREIESG